MTTLSLTRAHSARTVAAATAVAVIAAQAVCTVVAIAADWRTAFQASAAGDSVAHAFVSSGSAISAPVMPLVVLAAAALLLRRSDRWGTAGAVLLIVVGLAFAAGTIGEVLSDPTAYASRAVLIASGVVGTVEAVALLAAGARAIRR